MTARVRDGGRTRRVVEQIGAKLQILGDAHRSEDAAPFRHEHQPHRGSAGRISARHVLSAKAHRTLRATRPITARINVDLPAPFGPSTATSSPSPTNKLTAARASTCP